MKELMENLEEKEVSQMSEDELIIYAIDVLQENLKLPLSAGFVMCKKHQQYFSEQIKKIEDILKHKRFFTRKYKKELKELQEKYQQNEEYLDEYRGIFYNNDFKTFKAIMEKHPEKQIAPKQTANTLTHTYDSGKDFDDFDEMYQ